MALYNTTYYNADQYNLTADLLALSDTVTATDADVTKSVILPRQDSTTGIDTIGRNIGPDIDDMIAITELRTVLYSLVRDDSTLVTEELMAFVSLGAFLETISSTDTIVWDNTASFSDFLFVDDPFIRVEISDKALRDVLRLADWLSIERNPHVDGWGD